MRRVILIWAFAALFAIVGGALAAPGPAISSILLDRTNVLVKVSVPEGVRKVTLEGRARLEGSAWQPRALKRFDSATTAATEVSFLLPRSESIEVLRIRTDETEALPANFFRGTNQFAGPQSGSQITGGVGPLDMAAGPNAAGPSAPMPPSPERTVVESDIWKVSGDTLYFFNNLRGLQVIDIANPDAPSIRGSYSLAASGEQMYVLSGGQAVLLTRSWCNYGGVGDESKVVVIATAGTTPALASETTVPGWIVESRMVGDALYVISQTYQQKTNASGETWEAGTMVTSIDLAHPASPVKRNSLFLAGYGNDVSATERFLFVITQDQNNYYQSRIRIVDISSADGAITLLSDILPAGRVEDKFKINLDGDVLTLISLAWDNTRRWTTTLENYTLADPAHPTQLGSLRLAEGEQLHGTRFDGKRVYVVTYLRIDPLWIVDLSNPAKPAVVGELHVPGWSTYLQPMGDRVLALGIDDTNSWRVALSLFDVSNIRSPALLSKVALGQNYSWSEATSDEKALTVLQEAGLVLVPYQGYTTNGYASNVQLIDLGRDALSKRGQISGQIYPRRATLHRDHVISISGRTLVSYSATDRDNPVFKAQLDLAWPVNKVLLAGDYLIEVENGGGYSWWGSETASPVLRVARADAPERILTAVTLTNNLSISGMDVRGDKLYVAQSSSSFFPWMMLAADASADGGGPGEPPAKFVQSIWDLANLPALPLVGATAANSANDMGSGLTPLWPRPGLLVWSGGNSWGGMWGWPVRGGPVMLNIAFSPWWFGGSGGERFFAFDVSNPATPQFKSEVNVLSTNSFFSFTKPLVAEGLVYLSHQSQEFVELPADSTKTNNTVVINQDWGGTNVPVRGTFVTRNFLDVVDFADASSPVVRKPVNIPGQLQGTSHAGGVIYTLGNHFDDNGNSDFTEWLDASAYDGVAAFLVSSLNLTNWPHPLEFNGADIFIGQSTTTTNVDRWRLSDAGFFEKLSTTQTATTINDIRFIGNLAAFAAGSDIFLYDATDRTSLRLVGAGPLGCLGGGALDDGDGSLTDGYWIPNGDYGISKISVEAGGP